jgi:predicted hotdog family 3-hydroxylacyl-ACP dehydratase
VSTWTVDVDTADHEAVKAGVLVERTSRVLLSADEFPSPVDAEVVAAQVAVTIHGGMPTLVRHCL